ncbi:MAG: hypothetical protein WKH64_13415 [Chloroflexia bacterium]
MYDDYLAFLEPRPRLHRVLAPNGSLYLHGPSRGTLLGCCSTRSSGARTS